MPRCLLTCHPHTVGCTFGLDVCKTRGVKGAHFALGHIQELLEIINYSGVLHPDHTDTVDTKINTACMPTYNFDIFTSGTDNIYDLIIMPDCGGAFFTEQNPSVFAITDGVFTNIGMVAAFHNTVFAKMLKTLIPGGYLVFSKMVYLDTDKQKNDYVAAMNKWFNTNDMPFKMRWVYAGMSWFVIHKLLPNATGGKSKARLKSKPRSKSKTRSKSKSRAKSKNRSKSKSRRHK